ncbi:MAG TPA: ferrous iron transport protein B [Clostridium sp.]|nr:ferrous iron transport protein B [Clostridium sp.]
METVIALMGQPNAGKSTMFNRLTGSRQHVGNWPGKTVEKKEGYFKYNEKEFKIVDLPGTYSLFANSQEEIVTRDYIVDKKVDIVVAMVDASQIERSLFLLSDYAGINVPVIVVMNMMDIAEEKGKKINCDKLEKMLGVPVIPLKAIDKHSYGRFLEAIGNFSHKADILQTNSLFNIYDEELDSNYKEIISMIPKEGVGKYSREWIAIKLLEGDKEVFKLVSDKIAPLNLDNTKQMLSTSNCKFKWIEKLIKNTVNDTKSVSAKISKFDKIATSIIWGKPLALVIIILGLIISMVIAMPLMKFCSKIPSIISGPLINFLTSLGVNSIIISLLGAIITAISFALMMSSFVLGVSLTFGWLEEVGYMARISYVFDNTMSKLGLQGKAIMPFLVSFGCNIGGVSGTRVIDSWGQKVMTVALSWVVPCASTWAIVGFFTGIFFENQSILVIISLFLVALLHIYITSKIFGRTLIKDDEKNGLIMELPPYHKPRYKNLFMFVFNRMGDVLKRALSLIIFVSIVFWALSYTSDNNIQNSIIYKIGIILEPVTMWFGLRWQTFMAFLAAAMGKEAALGVLASLFSSSGNVWGAIASQKDAAVNVGQLGIQITSTIAKSEALAFIYAFFFNIPCIMAMASTVQETHSLKWTFKIAIYYIVSALILASIAYHIGLLIF